MAPWTFKLFILWLLFVNMCFYPSLISRYIINNKLFSTDLPSLSELKHEFKILHTKLQSLETDLRNSMTDAIVEILPTEDYICNHTSMSQVTNNWAWDYNLANEMEDLLENQSMADFGAGLGCYGRFFLRITNNSVIEDSYVEDKCFFYDPSVQSLMEKPQRIANWKGYDGVRFASKGTKGFVQFIDLKRAVRLPSTFDWIVCLESGEYISPEFQGIFLDNIVYHARKGIIMSWSLPIARDKGSVKDQPHDYLVEEMQTRGFSTDYSWSTHLSKVTSLARLKNSILVFKRKDPQRITEQTI